MKGERQWIQVFEFGDMSSEVTVFSDSDWAGDKEDEEIVKRGSRARGTTPFESVYKKTEDHRQKQCRSRTVCSSIGSVRSERVESMMRDLGFALKPVLVIDAKATEHILHRHGIGNMKHIDVAHLWLQDDEVKPSG